MDHGNYLNAEGIYCMNMRKHVELFVTNIFV